MFVTLLWSLLLYIFSPVMSDESTQKFCYNFPCERGTCIDGTDTFICQCPHLYNGTRCENDLSVYGCAVSPCLHGGTCQTVATNTKPYRCDCIPGYTGVNCEKDIDECGPNPCKNGGHCIDGINFYTCNCTDTGYNGTTCEENINECLSTPDICGTGTCFDRPGSFSCECPSGFDGHQCANNINECQPQPCLNGGSCEDQINTYKCHCVQGFSGSNCQTNIDDCTNVQCPGNNSQCVDNINSYSCECQPGFTGSPGSCTDIDECSANPCLYGATCQNLENRYECKCVDGYQGTNCENNINDCSPMPCKFSSSCEDGVNDYTCHCIPGYADKNCSTNIDECVTNNQPCKNGATCKDEVNGYKCVCSAGWKGNTCEQDIDECESAPCENGGTCHNFKNYYNCTCAAGFSGFNCSENINECAPNPCQNGGTCHDRINGYECTCTSEYMGKICSQDYNACSFGPCKNNGSCSSTPKSTLYNCSCLEGFTDVNCSTNIDDCQSSPCTSPLVCFDRINAYECKCPIGYKGVNCTEEINECDPNPCQNGATCTDLIGSYNCSCPQIFLNLTKYGNGQKLEFVAGFEGVNCERDINECSYIPSICLNNGTCVNTRGDYKCQCGEISSGVYTTGNNCELSTSYCESADEVKLNPPACHNGGTCHPGSESYTCSCSPGYTGRRCMTEINECESVPCQYGGTCHDRVNGYNCSCIPGITGANCEVDIDECKSNPCLHEGVCIDHINGYECNCTDTGFNGTNCELNIDDCASNPCQNEAKCNDLIKDYNCSCYEGYSGKNCEYDIDECASSPCQYNGTCLERSKQATFDKIPTLGNFSYSTAAGYVCQCIDGITGVNCEINIDDCVNHTCQFGSTCQDQIAYYTCKCAPGYKGDRCQTEINECLEYQPCQHQSKCIDRIADYDCQCLDTENTQGQLFAGKNCSVELTACRNVGIDDRCQNGATCIPFLVTEKPEVQNFKCKCAPGFTNSRCEVPTTVNFNGDTSSIQRTLSQINSNKISFRFRTTLADVILMTWKGSFWSTTMFTHIELHGGKLHMGYINAGKDMTLTYAIIPYAINDGNWQSVILHQDHQQKMLNLTVDTPQCSENTTECMKVVHYLPDASNNPHHSIVFGHTKSAVRTGKTLSKLVFKGCMQDITVNSKVILDKNTNITLPIDIGKGCPRTEQCLSDTCSGHGDCTDLWDDFDCQCQRRYLGRKCDEEYIPVTFAKDNTDISWVSFNISQQQKDILSREINLSLFIRTREKNGLITFLGNDNSSYVTLELFNGYLASRLMLCQNQEFLLANRTLVDDGNQHFVGVRFGGGKFQLIWEGNAVESKNIQLNNPCPFHAEHLFFGGKIPDSLRSFRMKRNTNSVIIADPIPALSSQPTYKGTIQDAELNNNKLVFYNSTTDIPSNYTVQSQTGTQSGEVTSDICQHEAPCTNNGTCTNVFFNDFSCKCPRGFRGKNCSEVDFCDEDSCPSTATCQSLHNGFECVSTVTFDGDKTHGEYIHNFRSSRQIRDISVELRTLVRNGLILYVKNGPYFLKIRVRGSKIQVICRLGNEAPETLEVDYKVNDRKFHTVTVTENSSNMTVNIYGQQMNVTEDFVLKSKLKTISQLILEGKESNRTVILGYDRMSGEKLYYKGCLRVVRIGGVLLPFYSKNRFTNYTTSSDFEYFEAKTFVAEGYGCTKGEECKSGNQCKHSSMCVPDYYGYTCECRPGYDGFWCENNKNDCEPSSCDNNGQCVDEVQNYTCQCPGGYSGHRCQISQNSCSSNPCQNSAPCVDEGGQFSCNCSSSFIGNICDTSVTASCSSQPCKNGATCQNQTGQQPAFSCSCPSEYTGVLCDVPKDFCSDLPCLNGATCVNDFLGNTYNCTCVDGFEGKNCSINIDECKSNPCLNGGQCNDQVNDYTCNCTAEWKGSTCNQDVNECEFQPCQRGTCHNADGSYRCDCTGTGYQGDKDCATDYDECTESPCANGATCHNTDGNYQCNCTEGYKEKNCTVVDCSQVNCIKGTCMAKPPQNNTWMCQCPTYYHGTYCEIAGPCSSLPCQSNNTALDCIESANLTDYTCICKSGWEGDDCETDINECATSKPCIAQNTHNCTNLNGDYKCHCVPGFKDKNCSTNINECQSNPCVNGACIDEINGYTCNCSKGYTNVSNCMEDINECAEGSDPCQNGAQCVNSVGSYSCECVPGYVGKHCSIKDPDYKKITQDEDIWIIVGPVVAVVLLILIIGVIVFLMLARSKRATRGTYNPSRQEVIGSRVELGSVMKPPPEERLI